MLDMRHEARRAAAVSPEKRSRRLGMCQVEPALAGHEELAADRRHAVENVDRDGVFLDAVGTPGKGLLHDVLQEAPLPFGGHKVPADDDALELILHELR